MASLLPTGHVSAALGVVYMLALELRKTYTNASGNDVSFGPAIVVGGDPNNFEKGAEGVLLDLKYIELVNKEDDLQEHECLQVIFAPTDGRILPQKLMNVLIEPPYTGFFSSRRRSVYSREHVSFHIDEVQTVTGFRRQLLAGDIQGFITDEHGDTVAIPNRYWASERCMDILKYDVSTLIKVGSLDVFGRVSFSRADIDRLYADDCYLNERPNDEDRDVDSVPFLEAPIGRRRKYDGEAFMIEAAKIIHEDDPASQAELIPLALNAYAEAGHPGGRPSPHWAKPRIALLWRRFGQKS